MPLGQALRLAWQTRVRPRRSLSRGRVFAMAVLESPDVLLELLTLGRVGTTSYWIWVEWEWLERLVDGADAFWRRRLRPMPYQSWHTVPGP
jgi:hypothetical protein